MEEGRRTLTSPLAEENFMLPAPSMRSMSTSTLPLALLALTVPDTLRTDISPLAVEALMSPVTLLTSTSPLAVETFTSPVTPTSLMLPEAVEMGLNVRRELRGTRTTKLTLTSQRRQLRGYLARTSTAFCPETSSTST